MTCRILIAEDHPLLRQGLRAVVGAHPGFVVVDEATRGHDAVRLTLALTPDVLLLDLSMPDLGGLEVVAQIRRRIPGQKIIALSESRGDIQATEALLAGCQGYLLKDTSHEEVILAVRTVSEGGRFISQELASHLVGTLLNPTPQSTARKAWNVLTSRERAVFRLIAQGKTNRSTAAFLTLSPKTVEKHRASLMRKLELRTAVELTLLAVDLGLVDRPELSMTLRRNATGESLGESYNRDSSAAAA